MIENERKRTAEDNISICNKRIKVEPTEDRKPTVHQSIQSIFNPDIRNSVHSFVDSYVQLQNKVDNLAGKLATTSKETETSLKAKRRSKEGGGKY